MNKRYITGLLLLTMGTACKKQFLELAPPSNANSLSYYKSAQDIELAVNAAYATMMLDGQYRYAYWELAETRSDNSMNWDGAGNFPDAEIDQFKETSSNALITAAWVDTYHGILLCNVVLDRIGAVPMDETLRARYIGEARFLRALMYFNLVRIYGDVPLVVSETKSVSEGYNQPRVAVSAVYDQIIADLTLAEQNLPVSYSGANIGRATRGAAKGLLGKVYLTKKDFASAQAKLKEVMDLNTYTLLPNYADLWKTANANNAESLFEVQFKKGGFGTGSNYYLQFAPRNSGTVITGLGFAQGRNIPTTDMSKAYETGDLRKNISMAESYTANGTVVNDKYTLKFRDVPYVDGDADNHWPVLRYADVLLMYAEAINEKNSGPSPEAYKAINDVRARAGLSALSAGLGHDAFALAMEHERQVELAFEGHRWFDLVRTGRALTVMNNHFAGSITVKPFQLLYPIPQSQVSINPDGIKQNPGY